MDLDIRRVIKSIPKDHGPEELARLMTPWGEALGHDDVEASHPRPLLARETWMSLDGWWTCCFVRVGDASAAWRSAQVPGDIATPIRVPFSPEAQLSGVGRQLQPNELLWYRRSFEAPDVPARGSCLLHFDGVDFACAVYLNSQKLVEHEGAYLPFAIDVTQHLREGENELVVCVYDPSEKGTQLRGKQRLARGGMWYTAQSGIWQSVWLELVPRAHVTGVDFEGNLETGELGVTVHTAGVAMCEVYVLAEGEVVASGMQSRRVHGAMSLSLQVPNHELWTPEQPVVYDVRVSYGDDVVWTYVAFRGLDVATDDDGVARIRLNGEPLFLRGLLDQGLWPDGLLTAPSDEALAADIRAAKELGFNMVRKHIKVEPERFYALCDRLGLLVLQDMPSGGTLPSDLWSRDLPTLVRRSWHGQRDDTNAGRARLGAADESYRSEWTATCKDVVERLARHPCIVGWVLFNESWGQFDSATATQMVWELDPSHPVLSVSGWYDQGSGDIRGVHNYFRGMHLFDDPYARRGEKPTRIQLVSEFGGLTWHVEGHSSLSHAYGYAEYETAAEWRAALDELLSQVEALQADGLAGFVYTQLTDVEEETNGLLTYDRRINKLRDL